MSSFRVVITGASSGIGAALARLYAGPGVHLALIARNAARLNQVAMACRELGASVECLECDVREHAKLTAWLSDLAARLPIDLLIANAGLSASITAPDRLESFAQVDQLVQTNLMGSVSVIEALTPSMITRRAGQIAVVSSVAGLRGLPYSPAYSASKAGIRAYAEAVRAYLRPYGVHVSVICPGFVDTPMTDRFRGAHPHLVSLPKAARIIKRGIDARRSRINFPFLLAWELRLVDLIPAWLGDAILRKVHFEIDPSPGMAHEDKSR